MHEDANSRVDDSLTGILNRVAVRAPIPHKLSQAANLALIILEGTQARGSKHDLEFRKLAEDSCCLVYFFILTCDELEKNGTENLEHFQGIVQGLCRTLSDIKEFKQKLGQQNTLGRVWTLLTGKNIEEVLIFHSKIEEHTDRLKTFQRDMNLSALRQIRSRVEFSGKSQPGSGLGASSTSASVSMSTGSMSPSTCHRPSTPRPHEELTFPGSLASANIRFTNVTGNQYNVHTEDYSTSSNFNNVYYGSVSNDKGTQGRR